MTIAEQWFEEGRKEGLVRGRREGKLAVLCTMLVARFGDRSLRGASAVVLRTAKPRAIDGYLRRVLTADTLDAVFED